ncbi:hypothetical protein EDD15DRAFT_2368882 [Pisolithus albus]|nr:hypothetical protein EDD15DRAFT_2368882 [Pisolithus albus]
MTAERSVGRPWTAQEDELLAQAVAEHGENDNWKRVAECVPGRTNKACRKRWLHSLSPDVKKTAWTAEEDRVLLEQYDVHAGKWAAIAKHIPGRTDDACSKRYREALDPMLKKGEWTAEEDIQLMEAYNELGGRWGQVGQRLQRSGLGCRNRWRLLERKRSTTANRQDLPTTDFNMQQQQQIHLNSYPPWDDLQVAPVQFQYASSSLSSALVALPSATPESVLTHYEYSSAPTSTFTSLPSTSTSPASRPIDFVMTTTTPTSVYEDDARQYDQLHRHTPPRDYYITPATHEDRRMPHCQPPYPHQHPGRVHPSLQRSDLFYQQQLQQTDHSYSSRDLSCQDTTIMHQPRAQYYQDPHSNQDSYPLPTPHDVHCAQQQPSQTLISHSPRPSSQPDPLPLADQSYPSASQPHSSLVHRSTPTLSKPSATTPYSKPSASDTSQATQEEPDISSLRSKQRARPSAPRKRPDTQAQLRLSSDLPATSDPSIKPRACYSTSRGLSDHNKAAHPDDVGSDRPYRCGLDGCSKSWKSINGLQYHLQISKAHFQHAITSTYVTPYMEGLSVPASVEASTSGQTETRRKQYACPHDSCPNRYKQLSGLRYHLAHGHPAELPAQLDLVPPALSRKLEEKMRVQGQAQSSSLVTRTPTSGHPQQP